LREIVAQTKLCSHITTAIDFHRKQISGFLNKFHLFALGFACSFERESQSVGLDKKKSKNSSFARIPLNKKWDNSKVQVSLDKSFR
jgi:hypothetical protein